MVAAMIGALAGVTGTAAAGPVLPEFSPANFVAGAPIDNPYFPLAPGTRYRYSATVTDPETSERTHQVDEDFVTSRRETIAGVSTVLVHARSWEDGILAEDTSDWYAQDVDGNVWYLGEDTSAFEYDDNGNLISTSKHGSWRTGVNGAKPGYIMAAQPRVGFNYYQEFAEADEALDQATIVSLDETVTVPVGRFTNVLKTLETSDAEPGQREFKYYAPGVGLVLVEEDVDAMGQARNSIPLQSVTAIPLPPAASAAAAIVPLILLARRTRRAPG
jgi:hypothetical protein